MGVCEPGQGGNAAAISNTFMCLGEPPRLSRVPVQEVFDLKSERRGAASGLDKAPKQEKGAPMRASRIGLG
jgi:hypothetical protein